VSYPKPTVEWRTHTGRGWTVQQDGVQYKYILTSSIEVKDESDFKRYVFTEFICAPIFCLATIIRFGLPTIQPIIVS
jgi:hypothetical protein